KHPQAEQDFTQVLALEPRLAQGYLQRALARQAMKQYAGAIADLDAALERGAAAASIYSLRARTRSLMKDAKGAQEDYDRCLATQPSDEMGWIARAQARASRDPHGALADLEEALKLKEPGGRRSRDALQNKAYILDHFLHREEDARAV